MNRIDTSKWKNFEIGSLFDIVKGTRLTKANMKPGDIRFIGSSAMNNGWTTSIKNDEHLHPANTLTVCYNGSVGETFYQDAPFWASDDVNVLYPKFKMNERIGMFIAPLIRSVGQRYAFVDKWRMEVMEHGEIKLPVDKEGIPDWSYMDLFMQNVMNESQACLGNLRLAKEEKSAVDISSWLPFKIGDLFEKLQLNIKNPDFNKTLDVSEEQTREFNLPLVNAKHGNNGIMYYGRESDFETAEMTIDIVQNGAIATGDVYAQPQKTGVLWDAYLIKPFADIQSEYTFMFLSTVIERSIKEHFSYEDKCVWNKVSQLYVSLPVDKAGCPDWAYMNSRMEAVLTQSKKSMKELREVNY